MLSFKGHDSIQPARHRNFHPIQLFKSGKNKTEDSIIKIVVKMSRFIYLFIFF